MVGWDDEAQEGVLAVACGGCGGWLGAVCAVGTVELHKAYGSSVPDRSSTCIYGLWELNELDRIIVQYLNKLGERRR
jgi:hypothetical protein